MARNMYGATSADFTLTAGGQVVPGAVLTAWTARTGGTQVTDLLDVDSVACTTVTSGADGSVVFYGPDGENDSLWLDSGVGARLLVRPTIVTADLGDGSVMDADVNAAAAIARSKIAGTALAAASTGVFSVLDYGAVGDGVTDDTVAIQDAVDAAEAAAGTVLFPAVTGNGYSTTGTITVPAAVGAVLMQSPIYYNGAGAEPALSINPAPSADSAQYKTYDLSVVRNILSDWSDETDTGIIVRNVALSTVTIRRATRFTVGVQFLGDDGGFVHNNVKLILIEHNKIGVDLYSQDTGWVNENIFFGGAFGVGANFHAVAPNNKSRYGIRIGANDAYSNNANVFHKPSFEIAGTTLDAASEAIPIVVNDGRQNTFRDIRVEMTNPSAGTVIRTTGLAAHNYVSMTYSSIAVPTADDTGTRPSTFIGDIRPNLSQSATQVVFDVPDLVGRAVAYNATDTNVPGMMFSSANVYSKALTLGTQGAAYLTLGTGDSLGVFVSTADVKQFVLSAEWDTVWAKVQVRCYNAAGELMEPDGSHIGPSDYYTVDAGLHCYLSTNYGAQAAYIAVTDPAVAYIWLAYHSYGGQIKSFRISTWPSPWTRSVRVWTLYPENRVIPQATQPPTWGTYNAGLVIHNAAPTGGQPLGWVCTVAGTPGTWEPLPGLNLGNLLSPYRASAEGGPVDEWTVTGATINPSTDRAVSGTKSFKLTVTADGRVTFGHALAETSQFIPVVPGETYTLRSDWYVPSANTGTLSSGDIAVIYWYTAANAYISMDSIGWVGAEDAWKEMTVTGVAPATAAKARINPLYSDAAHPKTGDTYYLDRIGFWRGAGGLWSPPGLPIVGTGTRVNPADTAQVQVWNPVSAAWVTA